MVPLWVEPAFLSSFLASFFFSFFRVIQAKQLWSVLLAIEQQEKENHKIEKAYAFSLSMEPKTRSTTWNNEEARDALNTIDCFWFISNSNASIDWNFMLFCNFLLQSRLLLWLFNFRFHLPFNVILNKIRIRGFSTDNAVWKGSIISRHRFRSSKLRVK